MIPSDITFDANATPPQWTDNGEQVIEKGTNIRIKIKGLRSEVDKMYAVGTMKEVTLPLSKILASLVLTIHLGLSWPIAIIGLV
jgi:DNA-directed RNA polymerase subunit E'/Rpb7